MRILLVSKHFTLYKSTERFFTVQNRKGIVHFCFFYLKAAREEFMKNVQRSDARSSDSIIFTLRKMTACVR